MLMQNVNIIIVYVRPFSASEKLQRENAKVKEAVAADNDVIITSSTMPLRSRNSPCRSPRRRQRDSDDSDDDVVIIESPK